MDAEMERHDCPICGKEVTEPTWKRFGQWCCSEAHAEAYVKEVRTQRQPAAAAEPVRPSPEEAEAERSGWGSRRRGGC
jgi:hypothetical protein